MSDKRKRRALRSEPQNVDCDTWYYEERWGLLVVHQVRDGGGQYIKTDKMRLPWKMIQASVERNTPKVRKP